jgi:2-polyprenyl-3-methyl-5-hydroxy-6-metoxy-1,4-benzoquinol methylase
MRAIPFTGERIIPELDNYFFREHVARYRFAKRHLSPEVRVLDVGCGDGYGAYYLSSHVREAVGIDVESDVIELAKEKYRKDNLGYQVVPPEDWPFPEGRFDAATCFEVFEHVPDPRRLLARIRTVLSANGVLIISTPNKDVYGDNLPDQYHVKEYTLAEFRDIVASELLIKEVVGQRNRDQNAKRRNFWMARQAMRFPLLLRVFNWTLPWKSKKYLEPRYFDNLDLQDNYFSPTDPQDADYFLIVAQKGS